MKRYALLISIFFFFSIVSPISAQTISLTPTVTPTPAPVDYTLPYPGLLPDSPLYKIKAFRDWLMSMLISDPLKKASFDVLQADKRLEAAQFLFDETPSKDALAVETLSKGENYFFKSVGEMLQAKKQGESLYDITQKLRLSSAKHLEVVQQMEEGKKGETLQQLKFQEKRIREFQSTVVKEGSQNQ